MKYIVFDVDGTLLKYAELPGADRAETACGGAWGFTEYAVKKS